MEKAEIKDLIHDEVRHSTDAAIQAVINLVQEIQTRQMEHSEEEARARTIYREEMLKAVKNEVKVVVNGKIDTLNETVTRFTSMFVEHLDVISPIIKQFNERQGFWKTVINASKYLGVISGIIIAFGIIWTFLTKIPPGIAK